MGWYTSGPGGAKYKHGDVVAAADACRLGSLKAIPRLHCPEVWLQDFECLGEVQRAAVESGMPWDLLNFEDDHESVPMDSGVSVWAWLERLAGQVQDNLPTLRQLLILAEIPQKEMASLTLSCEFTWQVPEQERGALLAWLTEPLEGAEGFTLEALAEGTLEHDWYTPPATLKGVFDQLSRDDNARHLVACMLGAAALSQEAFSLHQSDEEFQLAVDLNAAPSGAIFFVPARHPFMNTLAEVMGVHESIRQRVFYTHHGGREIEFPPEPDVPQAWLAPGFAFARMATRLMRFCEHFDVVIGGAGGEHHVTFGWHGAASPEEMARVFALAGVAPLPLSRFFAPAAAFEGMDFKERLTALAQLLQQDPGPWEAMKHILNDKAPPTALDVAGLFMCWNVFEGLEQVPQDALTRLRETLAASMDSLGSA